MDLLNRLPDIDRSDLASRLPPYVRRNPRVSLVVGCLWLANILVCLVLGGVFMVSTIRGRIEARRAALPAASATTEAELPPAGTSAAQAQPEPTLDCSQPTLTLGEVRYRIEPYSRAGDGSITVPADTPGVAYWLEGTETNFVFALSSTPDNLALINSLQSGAEATLTWENCNSSLFTLASAERISLDDASSRDQSNPGILILVDDSPSSARLVVRGEAAEDIFRAIETSPPGVRAVDAEISLLDISTSGDGSTITIGVSVLNYGAEPVEIMAGDVSLILDQDNLLAPVRSEPELPREIKSRESQEFNFIFPNPSPNLAVFRIFTVEFDLADFE